MDDISETTNRAARRRADRELEQRAKQMTRLVGTLRDHGHVALLDAVMALSDADVRVLLATAVRIMVDASAAPPVANGTTIVVGEATASIDGVDVGTVTEFRADGPRSFEPVERTAMGPTAAMVLGKAGPVISERPIIDDRPPHLDRDAD